MSDKKLTDNEIIKALECVASDKDVLCKGCSYNKYYLNQCHKENAKDAIDLINRQKAENEKLQEENRIMAYQRNQRDKEITALQRQIKGLHIYENRIKAEAIKEFSERAEKEIFIKQYDERKQMLKILKTYRGTRAYSDTEQATDNWLRGYGEAVQDILCVFDNLVKEMVGDEK